MSSQSPIPGKPQDPVGLNFWLLGGGMGCLAAAVHLIHEAEVPGSHIFIVESEEEFTHSSSTYGNAQFGYTIHAGLQPCFQEPCVKNLLSFVPRPSHPGETLFDILKEDKRECPSHPDAWTRVVGPDKSGPKPLDTRKWAMRLKDRLDVARVMMESEESLGDKSIRQVFDTEFFDSKFWVLWSTTFAMQSWHSASEFRRHLLKYLQDVQQLNTAPIFGQVQYTFQESIIFPIVEHLRVEGVQFIQSTGSGVSFRTDENGHLIPSSLTLRSEDHGETNTMTLYPRDRVIANIGPSRSKAVLGSNITAPAHSPVIPKGKLDEGPWALWDGISQQGRQFGNPLNFHSRLSETRLVTFTITLKDPLFLELYTHLTNNQPGDGALMALAGSSWKLTLNVPRQPVFPGQPDNVQVVWGYGLTSEREGDYIRKPMTACSGEDIMFELLSHLQFSHEPILSNAIVIPCIIPYATSSMVTRSPGDRPQVIPDKTMNFAAVGQFTELPCDTTFAMDYTVRSAQMAVYKLMGLRKEPPELRKNHFMEIFDFLK